MRIGKFRVSKKAVSPVIATLLMIAVAVAASVIVYVWSAGLLGTLMGGGGAQVKEQLIVEAYDWSTPGTLILNVRNVGSTSITVSKVYIAGLDKSFTGGPGIAVGEVKVITVTTGLGGASYGVAYPIKIATATGGVFSYSAIIGSTA